MGANIEVLLVSCPSTVVALSAEQLTQLAPMVDGDFPSLLTSAGLEPNKDLESVVVEVTLGNDLRYHYRLPRPERLFSIALARIHPVPALLRSLVSVRGLAGFLPNEGKLLPLFDPVAIIGQTKGRRAQVD